MARAADMGSQSVKNASDKSVADFLAVADRLGEVEIESGGKLYRLSAQRDKKSPIPVGSPFAKCKPVKVNMTFEELNLMIDEALGS